MELRLNLTQQRELLKIANQLQKNIRQTQNLALKADKIINTLEIDFEGFRSYLSEFDDVQDGIQNDAGPGNLKLGDRIVWFIRNDEPVLGTVLWIGMMTDGLVAGVEFDDAIGNTDGTLDGKEMFKCKLRHGRFVLIRELILWKDFAG